MYAKSLVRNWLKNCEFILDSSKIENINGFEFRSSYANLFITNSTFRLLNLSEDVAKVLGNKNLMRIEKSSLVFQFCSISGNVPRKELLIKTDFSFLLADDSIALFKYMNLKEINLEKANKNNFLIRFFL